MQNQASRIYGHATKHVSQVCQTFIQFVRVYAYTHSRINTNDLINSPP